MRNLAAVLVLFAAITGAQSAVAWKQFWTESLPDGKKQACAAASFSDLFSGRKYCENYEGDTPPNAETLLAKASQSLTSQDLSERKRATDAAKTYGMTAENLAQKIKILEKEIQQKTKSTSVTCKGTPEERLKCLQGELNDHEIAKSKVATEQARVEQFKTDLGDAIQARDEALQIVQDKDKKVALGNEILSLSNLLINTGSLENLLDKAEDNLDVIERSLNNSIMEAYIMSKFKKLAGNLCEAQAQCGDKSKSKEDISQAFLKNVIDEARVMQNLTPKAKVSGQH